MQTGSMFNHLMCEARQPEPQVGDGATVLHWTDRTAGTIVKVEPDSIVVQADRTTRTDGNGMSDCQSYRYEADPNGVTYVFRRIKRGRHRGEWREAGKVHGVGVLIGTRDQYHDYSF